VRLIAVLASPGGALVDGVLLVAGVLVAFAGVYLFILAAAALFYRDESDSSPHPANHVTVLIPAYNEADLIERCIASLVDQTYPSDHYDIVVIADNCTDDTAGLARGAGALVMVRNEPSATGKGRALRWAMDEILMRQSPPDAVVVVDADSVAEPGLLGGLVGHLERGADAVQGEYLVLEEDESPRAQLRAAAILLFHRVRFAGRSVLGMPCNLVGNGMLFSRRLLVAHPWNAFTSAEDLEYSVDLRLAGIRPAFAGAARLRAPVPTSGRSAQVQRQRWEGGRMHVLRTRLPRLLAAIVLRWRVSLIDAAVDLAVPPLGLLALATVSGTVLVVALWLTGLVPGWLVYPWLVAFVAIGGFVLVGLRAGRAPASMYRSLLRSPFFLVTKALGTVEVMKGSGGDTWVRTERPSDRGR
jgi:cellulose synthase/poly-beta-1,6-N-acetylglucosamine synthase-like glycosyltransferase